ncbi:uncharacterized protein LOC143923291 [Arctopsyche grandis]|uniref:uncharacterized protein LOC143923291 n=1 Tax=Arctopsyche grandis TaxID=121162 RepID=UPI00406D67D5
MECRLCLQQWAQIPIFTETENLTMRIWSCCSLQVNKNDGLPEKICTACDTKLESFTQFREACAQTDEILRERLNEEAKIKIEKFEMEFEDSSDDAALFPLDFIDQNSDSNDSTSTAYENNLQRLYDDCTFENMESSLVKKYEKVVKKEEQKEPSEDKIVKKKVKLDKIYNCGTCSKLFARKHSLKRHELTHFKNKIVDCNGKSDEYTPSPQINTTDANERVSSIKNEDSELTANERVSSIKNEGSELIAPAKEDFATTKPRKRKKKPNQCKECGKFLASAGGLKRHIFRHLNLKPHPCELCGRKFAETGDVKKHIRLFHLKLQKKFQCNICGKVLGDSGSHKTHLKIHSDNIEYQCDYCGKGYKHKTSIIIHLQTHSGVRPFKCEICSKTFALNSTLTYHIRQHTGENPFKCELCPKVFKQRCNLKSHLKHFHKLV